MTVRVRISVYVIANERKRSVAILFYTGKYMYYVYILTNKTNTVLYTGVTNDLSRRIYEHKTDFNEKSFTAKYHIHKLVYYEQTNDVHTALEREKQIKAGSRKKKLELINAFNPDWKDLCEI